MAFQESRYFPLLSVSVGGFTSIVISIVSAEVGIAESPVLFSILWVKRQRTKTVPRSGSGARISGTLSDRPSPPYSFIEWNCFPKHRATRKQARRIPEGLKLERKRRMVRRGFTKWWDGYFVLIAFNPSCFSNAPNLGSLRSGSAIGSVGRYTRHSQRSSNALANQANASSRPPVPRHITPT